MKFGKFYYVCSMLSPTCKKERSRTERRKQPTMHSRKGSLKQTPKSSTTKIPKIYFELFNQYCFFV